MEQVACGLAAAHREGIIHRDLKPANIMRDKNGRVVVMDFGLARTFSGDGMTRTGAMLGTVEYMSPEQAQGLEVKASSDIFTVGLILYELLAGVTPFHAESAIASLLKRTQQRAVPLTDVDRTIPAALSQIVAKCLERDPAKRYQNADELDAALRAWQGKSGDKVLLRDGCRICGDYLAAPLGPAGSDCGHRGWIWLVPLQESAGRKDSGPCSGLGAGGRLRQPHRRLGPGQHAGADARCGSQGASFINAYSRADAHVLAKKLPIPVTISTSSRRDWWR